MRLLDRKGAERDDQTSTELEEQRRRHVHVIEEKDRVLVAVRRTQHTLTGRRS